MHSKFYEGLFTLECMPYVEIAITHTEHIHRLLHIQLGGFPMMIAIYKKTKCITKVHYFTIQNGWIK